MNFVEWGLIDYEEAVQKQLTLVESVLAHTASDTVVFCSHAPVVTLGRGTRPQDVRDWHGKTIETSRGGRATYHGPNQLVIYPIIDLSRTGRSYLPARDLSVYLRLLEQVVVSSLKSIGLRGAEARTLSVALDGEEKLSVTGVWVGQKKLASIGIAIRRWVTYHGVAINLDHDPSAFVGINPCGFQHDVMTSVEEVSNAPVNRTHLIEILKVAFSEKLA